MGPRARAYQLSLALAAAWGLLASVGALQPLERLSAQARYWLRPAPGFHVPVTIVGIDEASLARYGQMPWNRYLFARMLDRLKQAGAAMVGIDVAFNEPSTVPGADAALAKAVAGIPTVLPTFLAYADAGSQATQVVEPLPALANAAAALGSVQISSRQQTQIWELEPYQTLRDRRVPAFPVAVAGAYLGHAWMPGTTGLLWRDEPLLLNFRGPAQTAPLIPAATLLDSHANLPDLQGRIVLIGAVAAGMPDTNFMVPDLSHGPMSGVEISANALDNLLTNGFWRRPSLPALFGLLLLAALSLGRILMEATTNGRRRTALWLSATAAWLSVATAAFDFGVWLDVVPVVGFLFSTYFGGVLAERAFLLRGRNQLLERYASDLATESQRQRSRLEGELHDGIQQLLVALTRELRQIRKHRETDKFETRVERAETLTGEAIAELKRLRQDLLPPALRQGGLAEALPQLAEEMSARSGVAIAVCEDGWRPLPQEPEIELYWLVKEALNNAEKHARAQSIRITLSQNAREARVSVEDDGAGFTPPDLSVPPTGVENSGLHRMWLRMQGRGGDLTIASRPGEGTRLHFVLPTAALERSSS
ncbi:MAG TPA: CHASE2 domain-containing protein [Oscillatoriaceae cyanobacterium]